MPEYATVDAILETLETWSRERQVLDPHAWLFACSRLIALIGEEQNKLFELELFVSSVKFLEMEKGSSAAKAKIKAETSQQFLESRKLKAKIERVFELIRISKIMSRMANEEMRNG